ncbi:hypothetical protein ACFWNN_05455 [Lentzea sp. NPDC058450]|uniref:hypothetical protein n=1 Tax=Lentzea sp. NPDC058450 TaxID=3346505 RepID=UPI00364CD455
MWHAPRFRFRLAIAGGTALLLFGAIISIGPIDWTAAAGFLQRHALQIALFGGGFALLGLALRRRPRRPASLVLNPALIAGAAVAVALIGWGATSWLLSEANQAPAAARPQARVEAIKTGLGTAAGAGGVLALLLAVRRQWHQEITAVDTNLDASEKRITELYTKAVEQLGSDKAAVRLGGLYALERVAQNNEPQRQTIVNVFCAYLRMPNTYEANERVQELEVRSTAQQLLQTHLRRTMPETFWRGMSINLNGAELISFNLGYCEVADASFVKAQFTEFSWFSGFTALGNCNFTSARFSGAVTFGIHYHGDGPHRRTKMSTAEFDDTEFLGGVLGIVHVESRSWWHDGPPTLCELQPNHLGECKTSSEPA